MILVVATGSTGSYRIDEDGRVYSDIRRGLRTVWEPTGQVEEPTGEQREELEAARLRRDLAIVIAESRADVLAELAEVVAIAERIAAG